MVADAPILEDDLQLLHAALDASRLLILVVNRDGLVVDVNGAVEQAFGQPRQAFLRPIWELAAIPAECALLEGAFRPLRPGTLSRGLVFHVKAGSAPARVVDWRARFVEERDVPVVILSGLDLSERRAAEQQLRETEALQRQILDRMPAVVWTTDRDLRFTFSAGGGLASLGLGTGEVAAVGTSLYSYFHTDDPAHPAIAPHLRALAGEATSFEVTWLDRQFQARAEPFRDRAENVVGTIGLAFDVTEQARTAHALAESEGRLRRLVDARDQLLVKEQSARVEAELANARLLLLVEGSKRLARTRNPNDSLEALASLVVPALAEWSYVVHRGWDGGPALVTGAHGDPNKESLLRGLQSCVPDLAAPDGAAKVFRTGEVALYEDIKPDQLLPSQARWPLVGTQDPRHLRTIRELGMRSLLCVPIMGRSGVDAVMLLVSASDPHRYDAEDVVMARHLANRAAVSLENGRLLFEALDAVRARDDFLAVAAHELRTPLAAMLLQVQMIGRSIYEGRIEPAAARRSVSAAETQARRLSVLIDGMLDVVQLASQRIWLRLEDVDLRELIARLLNRLAPQLSRAGCEVTVAASEQVDGRWDRARIEQVLTHLLTNAMKFGAGRPIEVSARATEGNVVISVRDHGFGISKEDQARIFDRFERAVSTRHFGGLGLGLYTTVQILRAHQGDLRVESEPGQGACFIVELPRRAAHAPERADAAPSPPS